MGWRWCGSRAPCLPGAAINPIEPPLPPRGQCASDPVSIALDDPQARITRPRRVLGAFDSSRFLAFSRFLARAVRLVPRNRVLESPYRRASVGMQLKVCRSCVVRSDSARTWCIPFAIFGRLAPVRWLPAYPAAHS